MFNEEIRCRQIQQTLLEAELNEGKLEPYFRKSETPMMLIVHLVFSCESYF